MSPARLEMLIEEATVDCCNDSEEITGLFTMLEESLDLPFETEVLGVHVVVERIDLGDDESIVLGDDESIVVVCRSGRVRQRIPVLDLPLPNPAPEGAEWIQAYRRWARGR